MFDIVLVGAGGFAREVYYWSKAAFSPEQYRIKGFLSDYPDDLSGYKNIREPILGEILDYEIQPNDRFIYAIGSMEKKRYLINELKKKGAQFLTLIHPTVIVVESAQIGEGVILCPFALISDNAKLGDYVMANIYSSVGHDAEIGAYSILSPYGSILGRSKLEEEVFVGSHSTVGARKIVGRKAQISANSVAFRNVPEEALIMGVPGKKVL